MHYDLSRGAQKERDIYDIQFQENKGLSEQIVSLLRLKFSSQQDDNINFDKFQ